MRKLTIALIITAGLAALVENSAAANNTYYPFAKQSIQQRAMFVEIVTTHCKKGDWKYFPAHVETICNCFANGLADQITSADIIDAFVYDKMTPRYTRIRTDVIKSCDSSYFKDRE